MGKRAAAHVANPPQGELLPSELPPARLAECKAQVCGACLLELGSESGDADRVNSRPRRSCTLPRLGLIDGCSHVFHAKCIDVWAKVENSCPQCRVHFTRRAAYDLKTGECMSCQEVEARDQIDWAALGAASDDDTGEPCERCGARNDTQLMLLCDGRQGCCSRSCHTYCDGHGRTVPPGSWYCQLCRASPAEWGREGTAASRQRRVSSQEKVTRPAAKRRINSSGRGHSGGMSDASTAVTPPSTPDVMESIAALNSTSITSSSSRRGRGRGKNSSRASALLAAQLRDISASKSADEPASSSQPHPTCTPEPHELTEDPFSAMSEDALHQTNAAPQIELSVSCSSSSKMSAATRVESEPQRNLQTRPSVTFSSSEISLATSIESVSHRSTQIEPSVALSSSEMSAAGRVQSVSQRNTFRRLRSRVATVQTIDLEEDDAVVDGKAASSEAQVEAESISTEGASAVEPSKKWFLLALPPQFEVWTERFRRFASTYLVCERGLPHVLRKVERLWSLSVGGYVREPSGFVLEEESDGWEVSMRRFMRFAHDTFKLHWASIADSVDDDPCSLRCLRSARESVLCALYCGSARRMKPSDVVRGELQFRRRLLQHLNEGNLPEHPLPLCLLPSADASEGSEGTIPAARAFVAVKTSTAAASAAAAAIGAAVPLDVGPQLLDALQKEPWYQGQIVHVDHRAPRAANCATLDSVLDARLVTALGKLVNGDRTSDISGLQLYSHQAEAIAAAVSVGQDVVISTSTGSGKSLVYLAAVFDSLLRDADATAILIFPTKALAQDQLGKLKRLIGALGTCGVPQEQLICACLDGDTPTRERTRVRRDARVILTNPDMLHSHVLPRHGEYGRVLEHLRYVVLDEMHVYRGAFGAHVSCVLRRLRRLLGRAGSNRSTGMAEREADGQSSSLQFVACSATVSNPGEHFQRLVGPRARPSKVITTDGSPSGGAGHVLWNPGPHASAAWIKPSDPNRSTDMIEEVESAQLDAEQVASTAEPSTKEDISRRSPIVEVARLLAWLVAHNLSVLAFCKWRSLVEIILQDVQEALVASGAKEMAQRVISYRAGYPPAMRRELERRIFSRDALGVVCTNALELGVDIGRLDCTISLGFPGSIASLRQQFGRAGRAGRAGISFFVAFDDPTDQHIMRNPAEFLAKCPEAVALAPLNPAVLRGHLPCAAVEEPITPADAQLWVADEPAVPGQESVSTGSGAQVAIWTSVVERCKREGLLNEHLEGDLQVLTGVGAPHRAVSIRAVDARYEVVVEDPGTTRIFDDDTVGGFARPGSESARSVASGTVIDELEASKAFYSIHPGAVYRCRGQEYHIVNLNLHRRRATARRCENTLAYYTRAFDSTVYRILSRERHGVHGCACVFGGQVERESRVKSFKKYWKSRDAPYENEVELDLPAWHLHTRGLWFEFPDDSALLSAPSAEATGATAASAHSDEGWNWAGAHAAMHSLLHVLPRFVLADRADLDAACVDEYGAPPMERPRLLLFDAQEGGTGLCDAAVPHAFAILREACRLVEDCPCEDGCPSCIVHPQCREYNRLLSKPGALAWLRGMVGSIDKAGLS